VIVLRRSGTNIYLANRFGGFGRLQQAVVFPDRRAAMIMRKRFPASVQLACVDVVIRHGAIILD